MDNLEPAVVKHPEEQELKELDGIPIIDPDDFPKVDDGLVSCLEMSKIYQQNKNACDSGMLVAMQVALKAQKALCDAEKAEAVKKVFSDLRSKMWHSESQYCDREYRITVEDYESILSQMEGE